MEKKIHVFLVLSKDMFKFAEKIHFGIIVNLRMGDGGFPMIMIPIKYDDLAILPYRTYDL
ncbi:hypothetical protein [Prevotella histicola]|uniref:hypothetical protein n=1 Tax=Prevotella histicola TaxID=470565 RepID=UPI003C77A049